MSNLDWITHLLAAEQLAWSPRFEVMMADGSGSTSPFHPLDAASNVRQTASMHRQFPLRRVIAFARRIDEDTVYCIVLSDPAKERGMVLAIHDDAPWGCEVDAEYASLDKWAESALAELEDRTQDKPI